MLLPTKLLHTNWGNLRTHSPDTAREHLTDNVVWYHNLKAKARPEPKRRALRHLQQLETAVIDESLVSESCPIS
jgi:hypothetical protein